MSIFKKSKRYAWIFAGIGMVTLIYLPMLILGDKALLVVLDQLDGEVIGYMLNAEHLFDSAIPEIFANGVSKTAFMPPSFLSMLLYCIFSAKTAYMINYYLVAVCAFVGMYLCGIEIVGKKYISFLVAIVFSVLPFYSVYGLSVMGQPLLLYAFISVYKDKKPVWMRYLLIVFFGLSSSPVLVGYADLCVIFIAAVILSLKRNRQTGKVWLGLAVLLLTYIITDFRLIWEMLFGNTVSHKSEIVQKGISLKSAIKESVNCFLHGHYHAESKHEFILIIAVIALILWLGLYIFKRKINKKAMLLAGFITAAFLIAVLYGVFRTEAVANIRNVFGGAIASFQFDRFYWLYPCIWFLIFAMSLGLIQEAFENLKIINVILVLLSLIIGYNVISVAPAGQNIIKLINSDYANENYVTWDDYYCEDLFAEIKDYIGEPCNTYRTASIGLYPATAAYNGFYCIDGYSNNYSLEYKHKFRKIIAKELEKDGSLKNYYDNWGNRCYIFCSEIPKKYQIKKDAGIVIKNLDIDTEKMQNLGCKYIFSALPIENFRELNLNFCKSFENANCKFKVYLYSV